MADLPTLVTARLTLRAFVIEDAPVVAELCGAWEIAATTAHIPHPYTHSMAVAWIWSHPKAFEDGQSLTLAITLTESGELVGAIGIHMNPAAHSAEIGYWVGVPYWKRGYATEATEAIIRYGFEELDLNRIYARHMTKNPASGRVMQKAGMKLEGILRQSIYRWENYEDAAIYSILKEEYQAPMS